ncbi:DNA-processing protein DprA [Actinopolyspora saharensis]|uniref:DNA-processing protein DprA n=1 Tax=Actinopolyspora saharensis TaxID=995062 RepID=UPI003F681F8B
MSSWDDEERAALVALLRARPEGMSWSTITSEVAEAGSACAVRERFGRPSSGETTLFEVTAQAIPPGGEIEQALEDLASWRGEDFEFLTFRDEYYPRRLLEVNQVPPFVFARGKLVPDESAVSVVGSRAASEHARAVAADVARGLSDAGFTVLSGLANGIDAAAHMAALDSGGRTVAILGNGVRRVYPAENRELQERIAREGLVLSQFWPDSPPTKQSFPMRNATMSAYGVATVVVEAGEHSGARIQARLAVEHGRPVILMKPVARGTDWGAQLSVQPGVFVVDTPEEAVEVAERLASGEREVSRLLALATS